MEQVTGIGGVFFRSRDPDSLSKWYLAHLGIALTPANYGEPSWWQEAGPTVFAPGTVDAADLGQVTTFELRLKGSVLGVLSLCPVPAASFTSEGGFKAPADFAWTPTADEELTERLSKLMDGFKG